MPVNAYTGKTGAGKTHQVMEHVIIPKVAEGVSVVTNIDGIDYDGIVWYILCKNRDLTEKVKLEDGTEYIRPKIVCLGSIRHITDDLLEDTENLFPRFEVKKGVKTVVDGHIHAGEFVVIDEVANWWGQDCNIPRSHGRFFREHRHFVNEVTHQSCDLVLIVQDVTYLHRTLSKAVRYTYVAEKHDMVGMTKAYKLHMFKGIPSQRSIPLRTEQGLYKEEIYLLYDSYAGGKGKEELIDRRQNVLNSRMLKIKVGAYFLFIILFCIGGYFQLSKFFTPPAKKPVSAENNTSVNSAKPAAGQKPSTSSSWHITGKFVKRGTPVFVLSDSAGNTRFYTPLIGRAPLTEMQVSVDGQVVNSWSGRVSKEMLK